MAQKAIKARMGSKRHGTAAKDMGRPQKVWEGRKWYGMGRKQARIGRIQARMGRKQARIGRIQARMGRIQARMGRKQARMGRIQARNAGLGRAPGRFSATGMRRAL